MTKKKPHIYTPKEIHDSLTIDAMEELLSLKLRWDIEVSPRVHIRDSKGIKDHRWWFAGCIAEHKNGYDAKWYIPTNWCACADHPLKAARMAQELCVTLTGGWARVTAYAIDAWRHCEYKGTLEDAINEDKNRWIKEDRVIPLFAWECKSKKDRANYFVKKPNW